MFVLEEVEIRPHWTLGTSYASFESNIEYKPGSENISDSFARLSCCQSQEEDKKTNVAEECVHFIAKKITLKAMTTRDVEEHINREWSKAMPSWSEVKWSEVKSLFIEGSSK